MIQYCVINEVHDGAKKMSDGLWDMMVKTDMIEEIDGQAFDTIKSIMAYFSASAELVKQQAETINQLEKKLERMEEYLRRMES